MSYASLYIDGNIRSFGGVPRVPLERAEVVILGVPFDGTTSYRPGSRFAPNAIREVAENLEFYSFRCNVDVEDVNIADLGNLIVSMSIEETLHRLREVVAELVEKGKPLIILGGEHTVTLGAVQGLIRAGIKPCVLVFDAHMDLRDEYLGAKTCHATVTRRISEVVGARNVFLVGVRGACKEEVEYASRSGLSYVTPAQLRMLGLREVDARIQRWLSASNCSCLYVSLDVDVFDPAYAPAVSTPEPEGVEPWVVLDMLSKILRSSPRRPAIVDVVEVVPHYDVGGATQALAARVVIEAIAAIAVRKAVPK